MIVRISILAYLLFCMAADSLALETIQYGAFTATATFSIANQLAAFASILSGEYDILTATVDNTLNYRFNQMQNVTILGQLDQGPGLVLASIPSITNVDQLRGKPIIVDSPTSGYVYLMRKVLSTYGLELENGDYWIMTGGGTPARYSALLHGALPNGTAVYATILTYPFTAELQLLPSGQGLNILVQVSDVVAPITSGSFTARESYLSDPVKTPLLTRFVASMYAARQLLFHHQYQDCCIKAIAAELGVSEQIARLEYASATDPKTGELPSNFSVNPTGILNVAQVRESFNGFAAAPAGFNLTAVSLAGNHQLIDYSIRDAAIALYRSRLFPGNRTSSCPSERRIQ